MNFKDLIKTTEGAVVLGGLTLTVLSPVFGPKVWAVATAIGYILINIPSLVIKGKKWFNTLKNSSGGTN